ncbi:MAG: UDP-2,3-diacylglucosamine diphosphatase [Bacteroidales bacterium]|nr:UDP-2,3-diacylglucosamine diphosphatase [Bacteroidales bacterium]
MSSSGKIFFASDFHLGLRSGGKPTDRERRVVEWLDTIAPEAAAVYLLGDIFDFWWEYRHVVPKGFTRFLGKISELTDHGIPVYFLTGNHDMWTSDYLSEECGMKVHHGALEVEFDGKKFHLAHGEGLGSSSRAYRLLLFLFRNRLIRAMWSALHPRIGVAVGHRWSLSSRLGKGIYTPFMGEDREDLIRYARSVNSSGRIDYFIFGHRHLSLKYELDKGGTVLFLGDWISGSSYAVWDGRELKLTDFA